MIAARSHVCFPALLVVVAVASIPVPSVCQSPAALPVVTVGKDSGAGFQTLQEAIDRAPAAGEVIRIEAGTYREKVSITKENIHLVGVGKQPQDVVVSWADSAMNTGSTFKSGTITVRADGFAAENLTIENTWEIENPQQDHRSQAVALQLSSDRAVLDRVRLLGFQDTLYANSLTCQSKTLDAPCHASRQFFNDCYIEGHVDYIFGDARAVFNNCELHSHHHSSVMITAQSRISLLEDSGYYFLHCKITGETSTDKVFFGRPWRDFATVLFYDTDIEQKLYADGWAEWDGRLKTATYREYVSHGPGVNGGHRIVEYPPLSATEEKGLTPSLLLSGEDHWDSTAALSRLREIR